jgi:hypothetical protein
MVVFTAVAVGTLTAFGVSAATIAGIKLQLSVQH